MGIIRAATRSVRSGLADQWLEVVEPNNMGAQTLMTKGVQTGRKTSNRKGSRDLISNGSIIHVYDNQFMILVDGGKIVDYTAEPGYFEVKNSSSPSMFNGSFSDALENSLGRFAYGGEPSEKQKVFYLNLQEIRGIRFGTRNPINYFDSFYNAELFLRVHGTYSIRICDPIKFYAEVIPRNREQVEVADVNEQFLSEFMAALQSSINQMSADGIRISHVASKGRELGKYMSQTLDEEWKQIRGMEIQSVAVSGISYNEESQKLINMRNKGAMLSDPTIREGYVQGAAARGMEAAGSNPGGATAGFMGVNMGMQGSAGFVGQASATNARQMQMEEERRKEEARKKEEKEKQAETWTCSCGTVNTGKFCMNCGKPAPEKSKTWTCSCGTVNDGKFCTNCGKPAPSKPATWTCSCGTVNTGKFCSECGKPRPEDGQ